jgi:hypothetical protein
MLRFRVTPMLFLYFFLLGIPLAGGQDETSIYFVKYFRRRVLDVVCFQASLSLEERRTEIFEHYAGRSCESVNTSKLVSRISVCQFLSHVNIAT